MSTRNELLKQIVIASGGAVTNPNNRNQLLEDWLKAVGGGVRDFNSQDFNSQDFG